MRTILKATSALLPIALALSACSDTAEPTRDVAPIEPAHHYYLNDMSVSAATQTDAAVAQAVERFIAVDLSNTVQLGDAISVYDMGARSAERMVATLDIVTDYGLRVPTAKVRVMEVIRASAARFKSDGGDGDTNVLLSIEAIRPQCTPRSTITLIGDGVESGDYSAAEALALNVPVNLPSPSSPKLLAGCKIRFVGFGLTADPATGKAQLLSAKPLAMLRLGWLQYLNEAGVRAEDVEFISTL